MEPLVQITRYRRDDYLELIGELDRRKREKIFEPQLPLERLSKYVDKSVTARSKEAIPDCLTCGACCAYLLMVNVRQSDTERLNEYWDIVADGDADEVVIDRMLPRDIDDGRCKNLGGELGEAIACSIYEDRPDVCRAFEAGSDRCHEYRRLYGIEPRLDPSELEVELGRIAPLASGMITFSVIEVDSVLHALTRSEDGTMESTKGFMMRILVFLDEDGETAHELHRYRASEEMWFQSDFIGMTLDEARQMIEQTTNN